MSNANNKLASINCALENSQVTQGRVGTYNKTNFKFKFGGFELETVHWTELENRSRKPVCRFLGEQGRSGIITCLSILGK